MNKGAKGAGALCGFLGIVCCVAAGAQDFQGFPDVPRNHWAAQAVNDLARRGILVGYPAETRVAKLTFNPSAISITKTEVKVAPQPPTVTNTAKVRTRTRATHRKRFRRRHRR